MGKMIVEALSRIPNKLGTFNTMIKIDPFTTRFSRCSKLNVSEANAGKHHVHKVWICDSLLYTSPREFAGRPREELLDRVVDRVDSTTFMNKKITTGLKNNLNLVHDYVCLFLTGAVCHKRKRVLQLSGSQRSSSVDGPHETVEREFFQVFWLVVDPLYYPSVGFIEALRKTV
jgi:hypothetical protein